MSEAPSLSSSASQALPSVSASQLAWSAFETVGQLSWQKTTPSPSSSLSGVPQPQTPGAVLFTSFGQPSLQSAAPSPSASASAMPQPQVPGSSLFESAGQPSPATPT